MQKRPLGTQGLAVSALGYGSMGNPSFYGATDEQERIASAALALTAADVGRIEQIVPDGGYGARYAAASLPEWV